MTFLGLKNPRTGIVAAPFLNLNFTLRQSNYLQALLGGKSRLAVLMMTKERLGAEMNEQVLLQVGLLSELLPTSGKKWKFLSKKTKLSFG